MRKTKRILKRFLSMATAAMMTIGMLSIGGTQESMEAVKAATYDSASSVNYRKVLGRATDFGILADSFIQNDHMETTFAANKFKSKTNNDIDMAGELPVRVIIGELMDESNDVVFGKSGKEGMEINLETTSDVRPRISVNNVEKKPVLNITVTEKSTINNNINSMISDIVDESKSLAEKTATEGVTFASGILNLSNPEFKDSVVYVNVASGSDLANAAKNSNGIKIKKYSSTVVVFNMPAANDGETLKIDQYTVIVIDKANEELKTDHAENAQGKVNDTMIEKDSEICQKIIWNMPNSTKVDLNTTLGCFLVPLENASTVARASGGWIATAGTFQNDGEWHFIYQGRSTTVAGQMNFAARKAFTHSYTERDASNKPLEDTTIKFNEDDYKFEFYETDSEYSTNGVTPTVVGNLANGDIKFPVQDFTTSADGTYYKYFVIKEVGAGTKTNGILNSTGEIDIKLTATKTTDSASGISNYSYVVSSWKYLTAEDKAAGPSKAVRIDNEVSMSSAEFTLGGIYNLADLGNLDITVKDEDTGEAVSGAKVDVTNPDGTKTTYTTGANGKITIQNTSAGNHSIVVTDVPANYRVTTGKTATVKVENGTTKTHEAEVTTTGGLKVTVLEETTGNPVKDAVVRVTNKETGDYSDYTTDANGVISVNPIDTGKYDVVVTKVPEGKKVTVGETETLTVTKGAIAEHTAKINNKNTGNLEITVKDETTDKPVPDASVDITAPSGDKDTHITDKSGKISLTDVPAGDYTVEVTKVPDGYTVTTGKKTTITVKENETVTDEIKVTNSVSATEATKTPNNTSNVTSTNTSDKKIETGDNFNAKTPITLWIISLAGIAALIYGKKKYDIF